MVEVTLADLFYRWRQFLIAVLGAGVVMALALLLAGLVGGISVETQNTLGGVGADHWVLTTDSSGRIGAGLLPDSDVNVIARTPGVKRADPIVLLLGDIMHSRGDVSNVNVLGVTVRGLGDPNVIAGKQLSGAGQVVADTSAGVKVGSHVHIGALGFRVVGLVKGRTLLAGVPVLYMTLHEAQALGLGGRPFSSAVAVLGQPAIVPVGLQVFTTSVVEQLTISGLSGAVASINNTKVLMYAVAAIIIAALMYVSALQRVRDFAVLKALGSSTGALFGSLALQAVIVSLLAAAFASIICHFMGGLFQQQVAIPMSTFYVLPLVAILVGLLSSLVALRQATGADPASAFG
jgi:putative ABC transport system permease protein